MKVTKDLIEDIKYRAKKNYMDNEPNTAIENLLPESYLKAVVDSLNFNFGTNINLKWEVRHEEDPDFENP